MNDRKYRQRGYMEGDRDRGQRSKPQTSPREREGPAAPRMPGFRETMRCAACGVVISSTIGFDTRCTKCATDLHTCRQCASFDPGAHFECRQPIPVRITGKQARNACEFFRARTVVERETSVAGPTNARQAFDKLFKK
jgi:hypothetical protein